MSILESTSIEAQNFESDAYAGSLNNLDDTVDVTPVQPIMPEAGTDVDVEAVQPLPLGPVYASDDAADMTPMQPIMPEAGSDLDVEAVQPLPLGPVYASDDTVEVIADATHHA